MSHNIVSPEKYADKWFCHWHRAQGTGSDKMIDLDGVGFCAKCSMPIYFVEATEQRDRKTATVTENIAAAGSWDVFVIYRDEKRHPGQFYVDHRTSGYRYGWVTTEKTWDILMSIRRTHRCPPNGTEVAQ